MSATKRRWHDDWWLTYRGKGASSYMHKRGPYVAYKDQRGWDVRRDGTGGNDERLFFARTLAEAAARIDDDPGPVDAPVTSHCAALNYYDNGAPHGCVSGE